MIHPQRTPSGSPHDHRTATIAGIGMTEWNPDLMMPLPPPGTPRRARPDRPLFFVNRNMSRVSTCLECGFSPSGCARRGRLARTAYTAPPRYTPRTYPPLPRSPAPARDCRPVADGLRADAGFRRRRHDGGAHGHAHVQHGATPGAGRHLGGCAPCGYSARGDAETAGA